MAKTQPLWHTQLNWKFDSKWLVNIQKLKLEVEFPQTQRSRPIQRWRSQCKMSFQVHSQPFWMWLRQQFHISFQSLNDNKCSVSTTCHRIIACWVKFHSEFDISNPITLEVGVEHREQNYVGSQVHPVHELKSGPCRGYPMWIGKSSQYFQFRVREYADLVCQMIDQAATFRSRSPQWHCA